MSKDLSSAPSPIGLRPIVLALTDDLFIIPSLEDAARSSGFELLVVSRPEELGAGGAPTPRPVPMTEPLEGPDAAMVRSLVSRRPVLILVDLTLQAVPWAHWISVLKSGAATRRIPILAFGPHVDDKPLAEAIRSGADRAMPRGAFLSDVAGWLESFAARTDVPALEAACREPMSPLGLEGLELFNQGRFFEAHEVLEHAWMAEGDAAGRLYRVLLQLAVAYHHLREDNRRGASKMLLRIRPWLDPLPDRCRGVDLATVRRLLSELQQALDQLPSGASTKTLSLSTPSVPWA